MSDNKGNNKLVQLIVANDHFCTCPYLNWLMFSNKSNQGGAQTHLLSAVFVIEIGGDGESSTIKPVDLCVDTRHLRLQGTTVAIYDIQLSGESVFHLQNTVAPVVIQTL
jgi:hypothetical protein